MAPGQSSFRSLGLLFLLGAFCLLMAVPLWSSPDDEFSITQHVKASDAHQDVTDLDQHSGNLRVDTTLVQINVTVSDPLNRFVTGLERAFSIV